MTYWALLWVQNQMLNTIGISINSRENPIKINFKSENFKTIMKSYSPEF